MRPKLASPRRATMTVGMLWATLLAAPAAVEPIVVDSTRQLFLDDHLIASTQRVKRSVESAQKFSGNPVLWPEPGDPPMATIYGSVLRDEGKFKMWYKSGMG